MLHDIGKAVIASVYPELQQKIRAFCHDRHLPRQSFERMTAGLTHSEIGALLARQWRFPEPLVEVIRYHHTPLLAPAEYRNLVDTVYLANFFNSYESGTVRYDQAEPEVLEKFRLDTLRRFEGVDTRMSTGYMLSV
jgi:HD-like signal output (HDOD) protein